MELEILKEIENKILKLEENEKELFNNQNKIKDALEKLNSNLNIVFKDVRWLCHTYSMAHGWKYVPK